MIKCPLCGEITKYRANNNTHAWICPICPFVGFEYYKKDDVTNLAEIL